MQTKALSGARVKDATLGIVEVVFASHLVDEAVLKSVGPEVIDKDGDVTLKGAFTDGQEIVLSAYGHASWNPGAPPIGKGVIREEGSEAVATLQFFMDIPGAADTFKAVQGLGDLQEWSYSLHQVQSTRATVAGKGVRVLQKVGLVKEVSPVLMGAGVQTRTLSTKQADTKQLDSSLRRLLRAAGRARWTGWSYVENYDLDEGFAVFTIESYDGSLARLVQVDFTRTDTAVTLGDVEVEVHETEVYLPKSGERLQFSEHVAAVVADVDALTVRASEVVALRAEKGKSINPAVVEQLRHLASRMDDIKALVAEPTNDIQPPLAELQHELLRFASLAQGV